jgi:hypothetical protein
LRPTRTHTHRQFPDVVFCEGAVRGGRLIEREDLSKVYLKRTTVHVGAF